MTEKSYKQALSALEKGVDQEAEIDPNVTDAVKMRTGVYSSLVNTAALAELLVEKGIVTIEEYESAIEKKMNQEVRRHEQRLTEYYGKPVTLHGD